MTAAGLGLLGQIVFQPLWRHPEVGQAAVGKMRNSTAIRHRIGCRNKRKGRNDHFITWLNPASQESQMKGGGSINDSNGMTDARDAGQLALELLDVRGDR